MPSHKSASWDSVDAWGREHRRIARHAGKMLRRIEAGLDKPEDPAAAYNAWSVVVKRHSDAAAWLMQFERTLALDVGGRTAPKTETKGEPIVLTVPSSKGGIASPH